MFIFEEASLTQKVNINRHCGTDTPSLLLTSVCVGRQQRVASFSGQKDVDNLKYDSLKIVYTLKTMNQNVKRLPRVRFDQS